MGEKSEHKRVKSNQKKCKYTTKKVKIEEQEKGT